HLVLPFRRHLLFHRRAFMPKQPRNLSLQRFFVKLERLFAISGEIQIRNDLHRTLSLGMLDVAEVPGRAQSPNLACVLQAKSCYRTAMTRKKSGPQWRSGCPLNASVEMLGDRWSLLIIRDMMLRGSKTFREFLNSYERIATNILTDRLRRLECFGIIQA